MRGLAAEVLKFDVNDPRDHHVYHALMKACTEPWRPATDVGDWLEDKLHENGSYLNVCLTCRRYFKGHKRRVVCRECGKPKHEQKAISRSEG